MKKTILVPVDLNIRETKYLENVIRFAHRFNCHIDFHYYYQVPLPTSVVAKEIFEIVEDSTEAIARDNFGKWLQSVDESYREMLVETGYFLEIVDAPLIEGLVNSTNLGNYWLVLCQESDRKEGLFSGSMIPEMMEQSSLPLIAIPREIEVDWNISSFAFACSDLKEQEYAIDLGIQLAKEFQTDFNCFVVLQDDKIPDTEVLFEKFRRQDFRCDFDLVEAKDVLSGIQDYVQIKKTDCLMTVIHYRGFFQELLSGSLSKKLREKLQIPMLVVPDQIQS